MLSLLRVNALINSMSDNDKCSDKNREGSLGVVSRRLFIKIWSGNPFTEKAKFAPALRESSRSTLTSTWCYQCFGPLLF